MRFFVDGKEVTEQQAMEQQRINDEILSIVDPDEFLKELSRAGFIYIMKD